MRWCLHTTRCKRRAGQTANMAARRGSSTQIRSSSNAHCSHRVTPARCRPGSCGRCCSRTQLALGLAAWEGEQPRHGRHACTSGALRSCLHLAAPHCGAWLRACARPCAAASRLCCAPAAGRPASASSSSTLRVIHAGSVGGQARVLLPCSPSQALCRSMYVCMNVCMYLPRIEAPNPDGQR